MEAAAPSIGFDFFLLQCNSYPSNLQLWACNPSTASGGRFVNRHIFPFFFWVKVVPIHKKKYHSNSKGQEPFCVVHIYRAKMGRTRLDSRVKSPIVLEDNLLRRMWEETLANSGKGDHFTGLRFRTFSTSRGKISDLKNIVNMNPTLDLTSDIYWVVLIRLAMFYFLDPGICRHVVQ